MNNVRPYPLDGAGAAYLSNLGSTVNGQHLTAGKGIRINKTGQGYHIYAQPEPHKDFQSFQGDYVFNAEYFPNDTVYVPSSASYIDQNGNPLTIQTGYYQCLVYVPGYDSNMFLSAVVPAYTSRGQVPTDYEANAYRWYSQNTYYPQQTYSGSVSLVAVGGYNITTNVQFWQFLGGGSGGNEAYYDVSASYSKGTIVWVDPNKSYSIPFFEPSSSFYPPLSPGAFVALMDIPAVTSGSGVSRFGPYTYTYPFYPQWSTSSVVTISGSIYNQLAFMPISPMVSMSVCVNNNAVVYWMCGVPAGATYQYQLPSTPH